MPPTTGHRPAATGYDAVLSRDDSAPFGRDATLSAQGSAPFGYDAVFSGDDSAPFGRDAMLSGQGSEPFGRDAMLSGRDSEPFDQDAMLSGRGARATGQHPQIPGLSTVAGQTGAPIARQRTAPAVPRQRPRPDKATRRRLRKRVHVAGIGLDPMTESDVVDHVIAALKRGEGGHIVTPNVDISRIVARDPEARRLVEDADLAVADGMPLVWAAKLLGTPVPGRITGADLIWSLSEAAAFYRYPVYLLGGPPGVAAQAACNLIGRYPGLVVAGVDAPTLGFEDVPESYARVRDDVIATGPRLVFVGLGFPKQDRLIAALREDLPGTWFVGCGSAIAFAAGTVQRAPVWAQRSGLEWLFRLLSEPGRLARRYLMDDLPYALRLLTVSLVRGLFS
ncbi:polymer biosynthesis protein, WecB/TagA/CpsF family [Streptosporangium subroseum]|uniref:Polymer biosynthesis protein, WecB/TagA/CpsF family n=2 Tax=Streptosporangium subroseum TaxID=106412 RepID=A0A239P2J3_9ACTN|nr:polymer biosynthesis protein, WecB/TagA/CpsF family [Streptosporangium subroseum]